MKECEVGVDLSGERECSVRFDQNSAKVPVSVSASRSGRNWVRIEKKICGIVAGKGWVWEKKRKLREKKLEWRNWKVLWIRNMWLSWTPFN